MTQLNSQQVHALIHSPDGDMSLFDARRILAKSGGGDRSNPARKRVTGNIFTSLSGRAQPRQGFLSLEVLRAIYLRSEVVRACVDMLIEFVSAVDWVIRPVDEDRTSFLKRRKPEQYLDQQKRIRWLTDFFKRPNGYEDYENFQRRFLRDLLIFDAAAYEIVVADYGDGYVMPLELGGVPGDTVEIECDSSGIPTGYWQSYNVLHNVPFEEGELAYMMLNPCSWQPYGLSPIETAFVSISSDLNATKYNSDYFAKNGIPPALLAVMGVNEREFRSVMSQLRNTSSDNPHNLHAFRAQRNQDGAAQKVFEMVPLSQVSNRDMQHQELLEFVARRICMQFKVTPSQIGLTGEMAGGIGNGIAEEQAALMQNKGVAPLLRKISHTHTHYVIQGICGWEDLEFGFVSSNTPQEQQEYERSVQEMQTGATTINEHRQKWGGRKPVDWGDLPLAAPQGWQPPASPDQLQQQAMQQMGGGGAPPGQPPQQPPQGAIAPPSPPSPPALPSAGLQKSIIIRL